jgi:hypothetical protein
MEEEDLSFPNPFFLQSANNTTPNNKNNPNHKHQNAIATLLLLSHNKNSTHISLYKHPTLRTNSPTSYAQNSSTLTLPHIAQISKKQTY